MTRDNRDALRVAALVAALFALAIVAPSAKFARSERCPRGHEYSRRANGSQRICRTCIRASEARYREARRANRG